MPVFCQRGFACGETARAVIGPAFWVCRAKSGAAFRCAKPPCAVVRFAAMTSSPRTDVLACPAFALLSHSPTALLNTPALVAVRLHFACAKPRWPVVAPAGGNVLATPFSLPHFRFAQMWPRIFPRGLPGYVPLFHGWPALAPRRSSAYASVSPAAKPRVRSSAPPGRCLPTRFRFAQAWPRGQQPGACRHSAPFRCAKPRGRLPAPPFGFAAPTPAQHSAPFRCAKPRVRLPPRRILPSPSRLAARVPTAKTRRSSAYASVSPAAKPRSSAPPGRCLAYRFASLKRGPRPTTRTSYPIRCSANSSS